MTIGNYLGSKLLVAGALVVLLFLVSQNQLFEIVREEEEGLLPRMSSQTQLSVVVPTYCEALNVKPLANRLFKATGARGLTIELIFVDDDSGSIAGGTEDTKKVIKDLRKDHPEYDILHIIRRKEEGRGLSSAVVYGILNSKYDAVLVMDADLQHEPEAVPDVAAPVLNGEADFSVGSRNVGGGVVKDWPLVRRIISYGATLLALPLTECSDPMSGFFCLPRSTFNKGVNSLNPMGYKIGLELMVRCRCKRVKEVGITFRDREAGESKLTMKQNLLYLRHLAHLYWFLYPKTILFLLMLAAYIIYFILDFLKLL